MLLLSSAIVDNIRAIHEDKLAFRAYFFFDFRDIDKQLCRNMISSVFLQLSTQSDPCHDILYHLYLKHEGGLYAPSGGILKRCLEDILSSQSNVPIYIIIDAIDECPNTSGPGTLPPCEEVLELVEGLIGLSLPNLRLCVTSRFDIDIRDVLAPLSPFRISLHDEIGQKQDIANYIKAVVHSDPRMQRWRATDKELVIKVLTEQADGM